MTKDLDFVPLCVMRASLCKFLKGNSVSYCSRCIYNGFCSFTSPSLYFFYSFNFSSPFEFRVSFALLFLFILSILGNRSDEKKEKEKGRERENNGNTKFFHEWFF